MHRLGWLIPVFFALAGCQNGGSPFVYGQKVGTNAAPGSLAAQNPLLNGPSPEVQTLTAQLQDAQRRSSQLDMNNRELTAQIAQAQQLLQSEREQSRLIKQQLAETGTKMRDLLGAKDEAERRATALFASQKQVGGATITANNSIRNSLKLVEIAGLEVRQEGTTIRIDIPTERLFAPGTVQLTPQATTLLDDVALSIGKNYPRQLIVVEGHADNSINASSPAASHQLTSAQATAVLEQLVSRGHIPANQISSMAFGAHRPRFANTSAQGQARNRRIEIVIYPDTVDGK